MKKIVIVLMLVAVASTSFAKKVKFACDMTGIPVLATGMHVSGDFQTAAGFAGGDWNSASTPLTQEPGTDIYSIVVDIPAFTKYEYKFVNGDQFYEAEFVPEYSRVLYNFNDNRWLYIDSLANDTTFVGNIIFGGNAPVGLKLVRFYVDVQNISVSPAGIHLAGSFQGFNPTSTILYSFGGTVYEVIAYMPDGTYEYKFINGNTGAGEEIIPGICSVNSNREIIVTEDVLLNPVCFGECSWCTTGMAENSINNIQLFPNPTASSAKLMLDASIISPSIKLTDLEGRMVREYKNIEQGFVLIDKGQLNSGVYFVTVTGSNYQAPTAKLVFE
jgi:alpha-amylase